MDKNKLLEGAYYIDEPIFAQIDEIFNYINEDGTIKKESLNSFQIEYLERLCNEFEKKYIEHSLISNVSVKDNIDKLVNCFYNEFGLNNGSKPKISIVDKFPEPFSDRNYKAMNFNDEQSKKFNVPKGIYILKKFAIHGICEIMIAHEIMHYIIGEYTPIEQQMEQCPFYEEGTVDFMGLYLLLKYNIVDSICIRNWLLFGRGLCTPDFIGNLYFKENKQIQYIARNYGVDYIKSLILKGTGVIRSTNFSNIKADLYNGQDQVLNQLLKIYDYVFACFSIYLDEFCVYKETLNKKVKLDEISLNDINVYDAARRLEKKGLVYILDDTLYNPNNCVFDGIKVVLK